MPGVVKSRRRAGRHLPPERKGREADVGLEALEERGCRVGQRDREPSKAGACDVKAGRHAATVAQGRGRAKSCASAERGAENALGRLETPCLRGLTRVGWRPTLEQVLLRQAEEVAMKIRIISSWAVALVVGAACSGTQPSVKPDDMSAAEHRDAARHERELAQQNARPYDPGASRASPLAPPAAPSNDVVFPASVYNPTEGYLREADKHRAHAREHER